MKSRQSTPHPFQSFDVNDVHIGYSPAVQASGASAPQSLTIDFQTSKGWVRMRLEGDVCLLFGRRYHEHTQGRLK